MDFFTKTDVPDEIEAKIKVEHKMEFKHEISKDLLFKNEIKKDFKTKTDFKEFEIKMEMKDDLENSEFQNGLDVIETLKCDTTDEKIRNKIGEAKQIRLCTSTLMTPKNKSDCIEKKEVKPKEFKIKIEPKDEIEDGEFQNGLRVIFKSCSNSQLLRRVL